MYIFFFKQKTAYEMRISDWSSDVCSSDLCADRGPGRRSPTTIPTASCCAWSPCRAMHNRPRSRPANTTNPPLRHPLTVDQPPSADPGARALAQQQQRRQHADELLVVGKTDHPAGARLGEQPRGRIDVEQTAGAQVVRRKQVGHVIQDRKSTRLNSSH